MKMVQDTHRANTFYENELVMWHVHNGNAQVPIPAVVVRQEDHYVVIKARILDTIKEMQVDAEQLFHR